MSKQLDCNDPEFFRVLQLAMQTYALSITAGYCTNERELSLKECAPVRLSETLTQTEMDSVGESAGGRELTEIQWKRLIKKARMEKKQMVSDTYKADQKEWRAGRKEIHDAFSKMNAELSSRIHPDSEAAGWIEEFSASEVSQQVRYQKSWKKLEEKYAAKATADVDFLRAKIAAATDQKGWKPLMGIYSSCVNQLKNITRFTPEGLPCGDHSPPDSDLRVWILKAITNPHLDHIKVKAALDEHGTKYTYSHIVHEVGLIFKANAGWDMGSAESVLALSAKTILAKRSFEYDSSKPECFRCHRRGHFASKCSATSCVRCNVTFVAEGEKSAREVRHECINIKDSDTNNPANSKKKTDFSRRQKKKEKTSSTEVSTASKVSATPGQKTFKMKPSWGGMSPTEIGEEVKAMLAKSSSV